MNPAPQFANPAMDSWSNDRLVRTLRSAYALREAARGRTYGADIIRSLVIKYITPMELELVARGIPAYSIPPVTDAEVRAVVLLGKLPGADALDGLDFGVDTTGWDV